MMVERLVFDVIRQGIEFCKATPGWITTFFVEQAGLETTEAAEIEAIFQKRPPDLIHGYARRDADFPLYAVTLGSEQESEVFIGDEGGYLGDAEDPDRGTDLYGAIFAYNINVLVYANHPDLCLYLYQLLRAMLINGLPELKAGDLHNIRFSGGDMAPDPAWVPAGLFLRRFTVSFAREYQQPMPGSNLGRAWRVQSIHVDEAGAPGRDVGGVLTHVTVRDPKQQG